MTASTIAAYRDQFAAFSKNGGGAGPAWLPALRRRAFDRFAAAGFPTTHDEDWHYTSVAPIAETPFARLPKMTPQPHANAVADLFISPAWRRMVFVNGHFAPALSDIGGALPDGVRVLTLGAALAEDPTFVESRLAAMASVEGNVFTALNTALAPDGLVVRVPANAALDQPLHVLWIADENARGAAIFPRVLVDAGANSRLAIIENFAGRGAERYFTNSVTEIRMGDGARVEYYRLQRETAAAYHVGTVQATQGKDSTLHALSFASGGHLSRINVYTTLGQPGSEARLNGLYLLDGDQHCDHQTYVHHAAEKCASRELYKGILDGASHGVFNGKVLVDPVAQQTDGKQTNHALLLSERARVDTKPQLEIFADDVKCTHGATVGRLDDTTLFYLKSRGIGRDTARALLTYAFAAEVLESIEIADLRTSLQSLAFEQYNHAPLR